MSIGSIYVDLLLNDGKFSAGWNRARVSAKASITGLQGDIAGLSKSLSAVLNPVDNLASAIRNLGGAIAASLSIEKVVKYADSWKQVTGRLSLVADATENIAVLQGQLFALAQDTRQPLADVVSFYSRLSQFIPETERAQYDLIGVTRGVTSALAITGESTISAQNAMIQFTQGIGTNFEAAGQELRSLQELAPRLTQALQKALGDGKQSLQALVKAGLVTRESVLNALRGIGPEGLKLAAELEKIPLTVAQAFTRLDNALLMYIGNSEAAADFTGGIAKTVSYLAENFDMLARSVTAVVGIIGSGFAVKMATMAASFISKQAAVVALNTAFFAMVPGATAAGAAMAGLTLYLKGVGIALLSIVTNPVIIGFTALATLTAAIAFNVDEAKEASIKYNKVLAQTKTALQDFGKQSEDSQRQALAITAANIRAAEEDIQKARERIAAYDEASMAGKVFREMGGWVGVGAGYEELQRTLDTLIGKYKDLIEMQRRALSPEASEATRAKYSTKEIEEAAKFADEHKWAIQGVTKAVFEYNETVRKATAAKDLGKFDANPAAYTTIIEEARRKLEEASPAFQAAKKNAEELKSIYEKFRPTILGISKEQDAYNQTMLEADRLRGSISAEAYLRIQKEALDTLNNTAAKEKENQSIYDKYETYLTGVTEKQLQYNKAREELQNLVGKKVDGQEITQPQVDTALDKYRQHLEDSKDDMLEWSNLVSNMGKKAAENIQDAFAEFLYDPFKGGLDGMVESFQNAIRKMAADLLASQLFKLLKSEIFDIGGTQKIDTGGGGGKGQAASSGTSLLGDLGKWFAGLFADGGFISPGRWGVVGEDGAEIVYGGNTGASVIPQNKLQQSGGSTVLNMNIYANDADSFNRSRKQVAASGMQMLQMASQRNG